MAKRANSGQVKILYEQAQQLTETQILYLLGEFLFVEIDEEAEIKYAEGEEPHSFVFKTKSGRQIGVSAMEITA